MEELENYPVKIEIPVAWGDMDAFNHVNNIIFFKYFESVRIKYFEKIGLADFMKKTGIGPILVNTSCNFLKPIYYPDTVLVATRVISIRNTSFEMDYLLFSKKTNKLSATGKAVLVIFDYNDKNKVKIPDEIKRSIEDLEGRLFQ
ncbi:MAG: acyl-CoA thioesterase [Candidatus Hodarchaeales archaeon]